MCDPVYIIIHRIFTVLAQYIIISRFISFILVILSIYHRFIGETVIKQTHLRDDVVYIDVFTEQNFTRDIGIGVQILITRSEERRVGKECIYRWSGYRYKEK